MRRVIRPFPVQSVEELPDQCMIVDGHADYIDDGSTPAPADAVYVATKNAAGVVVEKVNKRPPGKAHRKDRDGWPNPKGKR